MKKVSVLVLLFAAIATAMAIPAKQGPIVRTAEDGTKKVVYIHGNEYFHYTTNEEGQWLDEATLKPMTEDERLSRLNEGTTHIARVKKQKEEIGGIPNLAPHGLVILVNFSDLAFTTSKATMDSMHNGRHFTRDYNYNYELNGKTNSIRITSAGSVWQYFHDQSYGAYDPKFDVVGPVTLNKEMSYYGKNNSFGNDMHASDMITEACQLADEQLNIDFTQYDNDNDGYVDFVYVIYAGYGEADGGDASTIWPHQSDISGLTIDGKKLKRYACGCELNFTSKQHDGIGTFCHEFGHVLGLPDFYSTNKAATHHTLMNWDIMDRGCYNNDGNTPPAYSAYERFYMGWLTPRVLDGPELVTLGKISTDTTALLMCEGNSHNLIGHNPMPRTFYLLENREQAGWDLYVAGKGLLITKVTYDSNKWRNNEVNKSGNAMGMDIIEAKNNTGKSGKSTDTYPKGSTYFMDFEGHEITQIKLDADGIITFKYRWSETPVENVQSDDVQCTKVLKDGQVIIVRGGVSYDMMGRKIDR
ncbi:MAG: M6 family metalloprotease domain-containing protein [Paludibacteraceae bacterium]|nr:M6 family metalloprotease domain-containing protein [Paludibacteraceae bacterium]